MVRGVDPAELRREVSSERARGAGPPAEPGRWTCPSCRAGLERAGAEFRAAALAALHAQRGRQQTSNGKLAA